MKMYWVGHGPQGRAARGGRPARAVCDAEGRDRRRWPRHPPARRREALRRRSRAVERAGPRRPRGTLRRPARPQRRRQVDDDAGAHRAVDRRRGRGRRCSATRCPGESKPARARDGRRAAARQPRHDADRRAEPASSSAYLYRVPAAERAAAIERVLQIANLTDRRDAKVDELSGGMRRRLLIGRALDPPAAARAARRADRRPRPAGAPGAVGADRPRCAARARRS